MEHASDDIVALWDWRRRVADAYRDVRAGPGEPTAWQRWRAQRDELFAEHPQSPLDADARNAFTALTYFDHDPSWALEGRIEEVALETFEVSHSGTGTTTLRRFARVHFERGGREHALPLYWVESYGGGVFLPFRDATNGATTYGGGRYLLDTAKGADLGGAGRHVHLDFNYAYHPSCVHDDRWSCPLAPTENTLDIPVEAGERLP